MFPVCSGPDSDNCSSAKSLLISHQLTGVLKLRNSTFSSYRIFTINPYFQNATCLSPCQILKACFLSHCLTACMNYRQVWTCCIKYSLSNSSDFVFKHYFNTENNKNSTSSLHYNFHSEEFCELVLMVYCGEFNDQKQKTKFWVSYWL